MEICEREKERGEVERSGGGGINEVKYAHTEQIKTFKFQIF